MNDMEHTKANCSSCDKGLLIKVAKGFHAPDRCMCKACSQSTQQKVRMNLGAALKVAKGSKRVVRGNHRDVNFVQTHKQDPTSKQVAQLSRIYEH